MSAPRLSRFPVDTPSSVAVRMCLARQLANAFDAELFALPCRASAGVRYPRAMKGGSAVVALLQAPDDVDRDECPPVLERERDGSERLR